MFYPSTEYTYVDENGQSVEPPNFAQHVYTDNNEQSSQVMFDGNTFDNNQQQVQYQPVAMNGSQPL
jgi:hypothetical protein